MGGQRLRQRRHIVPLISLQVVGLHAGEVAALIPAPDHVQVLIQAAGEEAGSPEKGGVIQTTSLKQPSQDLWQCSAVLCVPWKRWTSAEPTGYFSCSQQTESSFSLRLD